MSQFARTRVWPALALGLLAAACAKQSSIRVSLPKGSMAAIEECAGNRMSSTDVNEDGRPDVEQVERGGRLHCMRADMNFDGKIDVVRFYDADGVGVAEERYDFDFDGRLDQLSFFEAGEVVRQELDTNFDNTIDTWLWCSNGWVTRAERDRQRDGRADVWETYEQGVMVEARYDDDSDGQVDRWDSFTKGRLVLTQYDENEDGNPDLAKEMPPQSLGPADDALRCTRASTDEVAKLLGGSPL
jgi:hypothetical protein